MGWLIALAIVTAIGLIPVGASFRYENEKFLIRLKILGLQFGLPTGKKKKEPQKAEAAMEEPGQSGPLRQALQERKEAKKARKEAEKQAEIQEEKLRKLQAQQEKQEKLEKQEKNPKKKKDLSLYLPFLRLALDLLRSLSRKLRIEKLYAVVILAGDDPCDLATNYGRTWAGVSTLMSTLNEILVIRDQNVNVECDFTAERTRASCRLDLTITIGRALGLVLLYGLRGLKEFLIFKKRKGGATI